MIALLSKGLEPWTFVKSDEQSIQGKYFNMKVAEVASILLRILTLKGDVLNENCNTSWNWKTQITKKDLFWLYFNDLMPKIFNKICLSNIFWTKQTQTEPNRAKIVVAQ